MSDLPNQLIHWDGNNTIVSSNGVYEMTDYHFTDENKNYYLNGEKLVKESRIAELEGALNLFMQHHRTHWHDDKAERNSLRGAIRKAKKALGETE